MLTVDVYKRQIQGRLDKDLVLWGDLIVLHIAASFFMAWAKNQPRISGPALIRVAERSRRGAYSSMPTITEVALTTA